jgi:hypothetical protein
VRSLRAQTEETIVCLLPRDHAMFRQASGTNDRLEKAVRLSPLLAHDLVDQSDNRTVHEIWGDFRTLLKKQKSISADVPSYIRQLWQIWRSRVASHSENALSSGGTRYYGLKRKKCCRWRTGSVCPCYVKLLQKTGALYLIGVHPCVGLC